MVYYIATYKPRHMVILENYIDGNGKRYYKPLGKPYISDIKAVDIECLRCGKSFNMKISIVDIFELCPHCKSRHVSFVNDGTIMINRQVKPVEYIGQKDILSEKRYKITFVEWSNR